MTSCNIQCSAGNFEFLKDFMWSWMYSVMENLIAGSFSIWGRAYLLWNTVIKPYHFPSVLCTLTLCQALYGHRIITSYYILICEAGKLKLESNLPEMTRFPGRHQGVSASLWTALLSPRLARRHTKVQDFCWVEKCQESLLNAASHTPH